MGFDTWMVDATSIRVTHAASGGGKKKSEDIVKHALGRKRGGLSTMILIECDRHGWPLMCTL